ncbi:hypothetical protein CEUSTIGMA_g9464.t1 [Chlamydomonas eustigma]|uniref:Clp R domain-containing protein n=1 Tax=Chlamydomonas eustigma TaxID=1157962 RepID=A0A250XG81_9CHLO|nr:hypothetical protein CEUSTIGMA_g9464.t1 [Chlamydomonas eustigma]|eukprot:GAX82036.1 hypothetical protein CEUSTIGMA_g9464.t1 [Chlamydomonas eustigma]
MIAQQQAKATGSTEVNTEHLLLGLIEEDTLSKNGYLNSGLTLDGVRGVLETLTGGKKKPVPSTETIVFSRGVRRTFEAATNECKKYGVTYISPEHILLALLSSQESMAQKLLDGLGVDCESLKAEAKKRLKGDVEEGSSLKKVDKGSGHKILDEYCKDLCAEFKAGRIDPVIGRSHEVSRVTQILARRTKNNPILLGEPGVGKTAIAEGLAASIVLQSNPDGSPLPAFLRNKRVMQLDVGRIISGAKERGELEDRMTKLVKETKEAGDVILIIDEVHTLVGAGSVGKTGPGSGGLDMANMIKPALARGEFQIIGATTVDEHRKYIERDAALERRFQPVMVNEPTEEQAVLILKGLRDRYERFHKCVYTEEAVEAAVRLSSKLIADRFLPDKAIDLMDEAGSRARITSYTARQRNLQRESPKLRDYMQVMQTKDEAIKEELFEEAAILHKRQTDYRVELSGTAESGSSLPIVDTADIERIVEAWTGIPVETMGKEEKGKLGKLSSNLKQRLIGQNDAVDVLSSALMRARCGLKDPNKPVASLLFVGPTGVGKTELAKVLAEQYFGSRDAMVRLDMSEYMERHSVSKLIGAPPGFVGYGEGGKLTEAVRRRPCCLILMDEVEKAHPDVFNILLQIMEDGRLTDSQGRVVSFKNALLVLTSNIGSRLISATSRPLGQEESQLALSNRMVSSVNQDEGSSKWWEANTSSYSSQLLSEEAEVVVDPHEEYRRQQLSASVLEEVKRFFRPELINRLDEQVVFQKLGTREIRRIAGLLIEETVSRVRSKTGCKLKLSCKLVEQIIREGYSEEYGARPLRQALVRLVEDNLSDVFLEGNILPKSSIYMDLLEGTSGFVSVTHSVETITVADHASGFNGEILVVQDQTIKGSKGSPSLNNLMKALMHGS